MTGRVVLITGANAGIGYAIADRLLTLEADIHLVLLCRNRARAELAMQSLLSKYRHADVRVVVMDTASVSSVYNAAAAINQMFSHVDVVYLNAGIMPSPSLDWSAFIKGIFSSQVVHMFQTGSGILVQKEGTTEDGMQQTFQTNLFGHFLFIMEIAQVLGGSKGRSQLIWTSSANANPGAFSFKDIQHKNGSEPYASSKHATDLTSLAINNHLNNKGVYSHTACPGLVMTGLTYGILPAFIWKILLPILVLLRFIAPSTNIYPNNGAEALTWLSQQNPISLDPYSKYQSRSYVRGGSYVTPIKMPVENVSADKLYRKLQQLERELESDSGPY